MDHRPNQSAQEAALSAVNLAPAPDLSTDSPAPQRSQGETLVNTHGLLILERTSDGNPSWLACKFCPIFGCKKRRKGYLMMYMAPFKLGKIEGHLQNEHPEQWNQFKDLDQQQKKQFFQGKTLPPPAKFRARMEELKKSWCPPTKSKKRKRKQSNSDEPPSKSRKGLPARAAQMETRRYFKTPPKPSPLSTHEDWIGRTSFQVTVKQSDEVDDDHPPHPLDILEKGGPHRSEASLPGINVYQHLREILLRYSEPFSRDLLHVVNQPLDGQTELEGDDIMPPWNENSSKALLAARAVFYLLRGIPVDVVTTLLEESNNEAREQSMDTAEKGTVPKTIRVNVPGKIEGADTIEKREDVMVEQAHNMGAFNATKQGDILQNQKDMHNSSERSQDWKKFVSNTANSVEIASLLAIKRILSKEESWAFAIITRSCPIRKDAVEILIPTSRRAIDVNVSALEMLGQLDGALTARLAAPERTTSMESETKDDAPGSMTKPDHVEVGNTTDVITSTEQNEKDKTVSGLVSLIFTAWLVFTTPRIAPFFDSEVNTNEWVRGCVKTCLHHTLVFLNESSGTRRAEVRARANFGNSKFCTDWITATSAEDTAIERARANYSSRSHPMSTSQWAAEKKVIHGLASSFQKALALTPGAKFTATMMYAKGIIGKAITDFEKVVPAITILPKVAPDPLHVVSVRKGSHAVKSVIALLNLLYPQWPSQLIGIRSGVPDDTVAKGLEKELVNALQERRTVDLQIVNDSIPDEERPIYPSTLAKMNASEFRKLIDTYIKEPSRFEDGFVQKLVLQHEALRLIGSNKHELSWRADQRRNMGQLDTFVQGLELLWERKLDSEKVDLCMFSGLVYDDGKGEAVDPDVEHVFRARTLMAIEQMEKLDREDRRVQGRGSALKNCLIPWEKSWSNLLTTSTG